jgi:hypothetical protein
MKKTFSLIAIVVLLSCKASRDKADVEIQEPIKFNFSDSKDMDALIFNEKMFEITGDTAKVLRQFIDTYLKVIKERDSLLLEIEKQKKQLK